MSSDIETAFSGFEFKVGERIVHKSNPAIGFTVIDRLLLESETMPHYLSGSRAGRGQRSKQHLWRSNHKTQLMPF
jgi:hypothetical protein